MSIQPVIAAYQHHMDSSIQCPDVVSFCPFKPPTTTFCLHFSIKSSIFIPPALSPSRLFILLLLAGDINPNPGPPKCLNVIYANIRSINNKYPAIAKFIFDNDTDLFAMSETWIRRDTTSANLSELTPSGYSLYQQPRETRHGGDGLDASGVPTMVCSTFENFLIKISLNKESFYFLNIYRPPSSSTTTFFEQFHSLLEDIHHTTENLAIVGDFNLHLDTTCSNSKTFHLLIESFDLIQKVNFPTHIHRHTLDQILTKSYNDNISKVHAIDAFFPDHFSVSFILNFIIPRSQANATVSFRKYHKINKEKMKADLLASELINNPSKEPDTLYKQYHTTLSTLIDKHAPLHTKHTKAKYIPGWVNETVIVAKETKRLFECIWRRNKSTFNRSQYMQKVHQYNRVCMQAKAQFLKAKIQDNHHNPQKLWCALGDVLHRLPAKILPSINPPQLLAGSWSSLQKRLRKYAQLSLLLSIYNTSPLTLLPPCSPLFLL